MRIAYIVAAALAASACATRPPDAAIDPALAYTLAPVVADGALEAVAVTLRFQGSAGGETPIQLPDMWGGEETLWTGIADLAVEGGVLDPAPAPDDGIRTVRHAPGAPLTLRYRVIQDWDGVPGAQPRNPYRPVIQPGYLHVIGWTALAYPRVGDNRTTPASAEIVDVPGDWGSASDMTHAGAATLHDLQASIWVAGDFRVQETAVAGAPLRVAIRGAPDMDEAAFLADLKQIIEANHAFWGDGAEPFLVTVLPLTVEPGRTSFGGTGLSDAFAFFMSPGIAHHQITRVLAHEHLHTWIPGRLGPGGDAPEALAYWFTEGFTDFYTWRLGARSGRTTVEAAIEGFNAMLRRLARSPARDAPNADIGAGFWADRAVGQLPYDRGMLAALVWDRRIAAETGGAQDLDDVMAALLADAAASDAAPSAAPLRSVQFLDAVARVTGVDLSADFPPRIEAGVWTPPAADLLAPCGTFVVREEPVFDRGYESEPAGPGFSRITEVDPAGPAWAAGLRPGVRFDHARSKGRAGDIDVDYELQLVEGPVVRFAPHGAQTIGVPALEPADLSDPDRRAACRAAIAGDPA